MFGFESKLVIEFSNVYVIKQYEIVLNEWDILYSVKHIKKLFMLGWRECLATFCQKKLS